MITGTCNLLVGPVLQTFKSVSTVNGLSSMALNSVDRNTFHAVFN